MTNEEAKRKVKGYLTDILPSDCSDEINEIMKALDQQPCEDCISREAVLRIISKAEEMDDGNCGYWIPDSDNVRWNIRHLPP